MSKQNPTVEDSEEYKRLRHENEVFKARVKQVMDQRATLARENHRLYDQNNMLKDLIKQFHYGPVNQDYIAKVKEYVENEGL
jgi:cell division protein FtsB